MPLLIIWAVISLFHLIFISASWCFQFFYINHHIQNVLQFHHPNISCYRHYNIFPYISLNLPHTPISPVISSYHLKYIMMPTIYFEFMLILNLFDFSLLLWFYQHLQFQIKSPRRNLDNHHHLGTFNQTLHNLHLWNLYYPYLY